MKITKAYCPNCGAPVVFKENRDDTFCQHCGTQVFRQDDQLEMKLHHKEKEMEYELKSDAINWKGMIIAFSVMFIFLIFMMLILALG